MTKWLHSIQWLLPGLLLLVVQGCATPLDGPAQSATRIDALARAIGELSDTIPAEEAQRFAKAAVETSAELGRNYAVKLVPWLHNATVVSGLNERGLCFQYAQDLYASLKFVENSSLAMHFVQANRGKLNEHHALVVTAKDAPWHSGVLLDAWRGGGNLYIGPVKPDKYPWEPERRNSAFVSPTAALLPQAL